MRAKELRVIDSHFHFCDYVGFNQIALAAGYTNTEECLHKAFQDNNIVHGVVMGNKTLDPAGHHYPDYMSYCIGLDSNVFYDDMDLMTAQVEENLKRKQCCGIKLYPGYNHVYVYDELYDPIYDLARKYNKPVAIHTGLTATANALLKYSHPMTLDEAAVKYPDVQFVMCHIGNPFLQDKRGYISMLRDWLNYLGSYDRVMFGTDWPLANFADYITFVKDFIPETYWDDVFFNNANRIYQLGL